jgi:hypothetical protein
VKTPTLGRRSCCDGRLNSVANSAEVVPGSLGPPITTHPHEVLLKDPFDFGDGRRI